MLATLLALAVCAQPGYLGDSGLEPEQTQQAFFNFVGSGTAWMPPYHPSLKSLPAGKRAEAVRAIGAFARAFFESESFRTQWKDLREALTPKTPEAPRDAKQLAADRKREMDRQIASVEEAMKSLPKEQQAELRRAVEGMRRAGSESGNAELYASMDQERYQAELKRHQEALARLPPEDPKAALRARLQEFLALTAQMPWSARLVERGGRKLFEDPTLEQKPGEWKLAWRAGREAVEAARAFATTWLAELR